MNTSTSLLTKRDTYKPFKYDWAFNNFQLQQQIHWLPEEVPMVDDVKDWNHKLTEVEKNFLTQIFRFFTQADIDVASGYVHKFMPVFANNPEITMMLCSFANMEGVHINAYSTLIDTLGMPESEYEMFLQYEEMASKHDYLNEIKELKDLYGAVDIKETAKALAIYSAFTEGLQLFSSFVMLLNFTRFGKMKGMGQIVTWSIRDESLHVKGMTELFNTFKEENPHIWTDDFRGELYQICRDMVELEDRFVDLAFKEGAIEGLTAEEVKEFVRYIADRRLLQLGLKPNFGVKENPLPWYDDLLNGTEHANFFENRVTEYSKGATTGTWEDVWA